MPADDFPLQDQLVKLQRILEDRIKLYRRSVNKGQAGIDEAARRHRECLRIAASFRFLVANAEWIRAEHKRRQQEAQRQAEIDDLRSHPDVEAVLAQFPGAEIVDVRELTVDDDEAKEE